MFDLAENVNADPVKDQVVLNARALYLAKAPLVEGCAPEWCTPQRIRDLAGATVVAAPDVPGF